ncbi:methyltransferase type 11, partial [Pelomonas sp. HMWF004]
PKAEAGQVEPVQIERELIAPAPAAVEAPAASSPVADNGAAFRAIKEALREGVQAVSAPQLFPTPVSLARRMVAEADIRAGDTVCEPQAGTGRILAAIRENAHPEITLTAVEIRQDLCGALRQREAADAIFCADFLNWRPSDGRKFTRILMNPPFERGQDIQHIQHALTLLDDGGKLVAVCANGPKQNEVLRPLVEQRGGLWEVLPAGTFDESGTGVNTVLLKLAA